MNRPDRGAHTEFNFEVCTRGFLITTGSPHSGYIGCRYAFDDIDTLAAWVAHEYRHAHDTYGDGKPESGDA